MGLLGPDPRSLSARINWDIVDDHIEQASFSWVRREVAADAHDYKLPDLYDLDERLEANLQGAALAGRPGLDLCLEILDLEDPEAMFVAVVLAHRLGANETMFELTEAALVDAGLSAALVSALAWSPLKDAWPLLKWLASSTHPAARALALRVCGEHRYDPGQLLLDALRDTEPSLRAHGARVVGLLGRPELAAGVYPLLADADPACRFAAAWSTLRCGDPYRAEALRIIDELAGRSDDPLQAAALTTSLQFRRPGDALARLQILAPSLAPALRHLAFSVVGEPSLVDRLVAECADDELAPTAALAFSTITGVDLEYEDLDRDADPEPPEGEGEGEGEDEQADDEAGEFEEGDDDELTLPDAARVHAYWLAHRGAFADGVRHLGGQPANQEGLEAVLSRGTQRTRKLAAEQLGATAPGRPLHNTEARAHFQIGSYLGWVF